MYRRILLSLVLAGVITGFRSLLVQREPDPDLIRLAVRATLYAMPTSPPQIVIVTRMVTATSLPVKTSLETPSPTATPTTPTILTPSDTPAAQPLPTDTPIPPAAQAASVELASVGSVSVGSDDVESNGTASDTPQNSLMGTCPDSSGHSYDLIPVSGATIAHPDYLHGDLNLGLRGFVPVSALPALVDIPGPTDGDPPQLGGVLGDGSSAAMTRTFRVNDWDWNCGEHGCRGGEVGGVEVSMLGLATTSGTQISIPSRHAEIYGGGYVGLVVFADTTSMTLVYTREDSVANGYAVHLEEVCVDPALLAAYRAANQSGRSSLPGIRNGEVVGVAGGEEIAVAIRDRGTFADPRSRKDWWQTSY